MVPYLLCNKKVLDQLEGGNIVIIFKPLPTAFDSVYYFVFVCFKL